MKILFTSILFLAVVFRLPADQTNGSALPFIIGAAQANQHYDQGMIVTGVVAEVSIRPRIVFLNLDQPYPNSPFTLVILPAATNQFGNLGGAARQKRGGDGQDPELPWPAGNCAGEQQSVESGGVARFNECSRR
jgi:hypothetical protein